MPKRMKHLRLRQLDANLTRLRRKGAVHVPPKGWIFTIRSALGMSTYQLARRVGVAQPVISRMEKGEVNDSLTLGSLRKVAKALECQLFYALVPEATLEAVLEQQARLVATRMVERVSHSMRLERQDVSKKEIARQIDDLTEELLADWPRSLWDES